MTESGAVIARGESETEAIAERLAGTLGQGDVVYLEGDLGAGKTTFARGLARGLGAREREVASPTFALVNEYAGEAGTIVLRHLDLYRLADTRRDLEALGLPDSVAGAPVCIEWPRTAIRGLLAPTVEVRIETLPEGEGRRISVTRPSGGASPASTRKR
jgi:tRNA threonylcarbamoyladenosine biosynthesis protein TsaE